jgi:Uma2 family endonuclease
MNRLRLAPPFPRGVRGDHYLIAFTTHLGLLYQLCQQNRDLRFERSCQGELIIMPLTGGEMGERNSEQKKMAEYQDNGARLSWLINRQSREVEIYRQGQGVEVVNNPGSLFRRGCFARVHPRFNSHLVIV